jgi:hypothetical protein
VAPVCVAWDAHCPLLAYRDNGRVVQVAPNPVSGASATLCALAYQQVEALYGPERLVKPLARAGARGEARCEGDLLGRGDRAPAGCPGPGPLPGLGGAGATGPPRPEPAVATRGGAGCGAAGAPGGGAPRRRAGAVRGPPGPAGSERRPHRSAGGQPSLGRRGAVFTPGPGTGPSQGGRRRGGVLQHLPGRHRQRRQPLAAAGPGPGCCGGTAQPLPCPPPSARNWRPALRNG